MEITPRYQDKIAILRIQGSILGDDRLKLHEAIQEQLEQGYEHIVLNMKQVELMDSVGLGMLMAAHTTLVRRGSRLVLCDVSRPVKYLLTITQLDRVLQQYEHEDDAIASLS